MSIKRIWRGWTTHDQAGPYQDLLHLEVFPEIESKGILGYQGVELFRRDLEEETEFMTVMTFDSLKSVIAFNGKEYEKCYVPDHAQKVLKRWEEVSLHYRLIEKRSFNN